MCSSLCDTIFPCIYARVRIRDGSTSLISSHTSPAHTLHPIHFPSSRSLRHTFAQGFPVQDSGAWVYIQDSRISFPKRSYQLDNTVSHQICAVKQAWAELVLGLVTTRESSVTLFFFCSPFIPGKCHEISECPPERDFGFQISPMMEELKGGENPLLLTPYYGQGARSRTVLRHFPGCSPGSFFFLGALLVEGKQSSSSS